MVKPLTSILWLNYNSKNIIGIVFESLQSIFELNYPNVELIVVDNGSTDGSFETIKEFIERRRPSDIRIKMARLERNLGFTGGVNEEGQGV